MRLPRPAAIGCTAAIALAAPAHAQVTTDDAPRVSMKQARHAARTIAGQVMVPFSERRPSMHVRCRRRGPNDVRCHVRARGDRLSFTMNARVKLTRTGELLKVYGSDLTTR